MSARVRVTCTGCGDVTVDAPSMTATIVGDDGGCYSYACPTCHRREGRVAGSKVLQVLATSGAAVLSMAAPETLERRPSVGELTVTEVERLSRLLDDDSWFADQLTHVGDQPVQP